MNRVQLIGRVTRDIEVRYTRDEMAVASFTVAIDRPTKGGEKASEFPRVTVFGRQAENCGKYVGKGSRVAIEGRLQTGSYERNGEKVYTTDVIAERVEFIDFKDNGRREQRYDDKPTEPAPQGFDWEMADKDIPF